MDAENPTSLRQFLVRVAATLLALVVLYPLSSGPAIYVQAKLSTPSTASDTFYKPLFRALQNTPLENPFYVYLDWWMERAGFGDEK